jgi:hypothetical protein
MPRFRTRRLAVAVGVAIMALTPTTAFAASTAVESISGVETGIPTACGLAGSGDSMSSFAGTTGGDIKGVWSTSVCHAELSIAPGASAAITGGAFHVSGFRGWSYVRLYGKFGSGSVSLGTETDHAVAGVGTCTQVFSVNIKGIGSSTFKATLVHYGAFFAGACHVFSATLNGTGHITY